MAGERRDSKAAAFFCLAWALCLALPGFPQHVGGREDRADWTQEKVGGLQRPLFCGWVQPEAKGEGGAGSVQPGGDNVCGVGIFDLWGNEREKMYLISF